MTEHGSTPEEYSNVEGHSPRDDNFTWMPIDIVITKRGNIGSSTSQGDSILKTNPYLNSPDVEVQLSKLIFVFIDAAMYYVDERGEHVGQLSQPSDQSEARSRLRTASNSSEWLIMAVETGERIIELARRSGDEDAWGCTSGYFSGGSNSGPNQVLAVIRKLTGRRPPTNAVGVLRKPTAGRWTVWKFSGYDRGDAIPNVGIWHLGFTVNPQFFPRWCHAISRDDGQTIAILPDSPIMRDLARKWNAGALVPARQAFKGDRIASSAGSPAYCRTRISAVLLSDQETIDGDLFAGSLSFLQTNHQLKITPFEMILDPLLVTQIEKFRQANILDQPWSKSEATKLQVLRKRYDRSQRVFKWFAEINAMKPDDLFDPGSTSGPSLRTELRVVDEASRTGRISSVLYRTWTGWAGHPNSRETILSVPLLDGVPGRYFDWYRQVFEIAAKHGIVDKEWFDKRVEWHGDAFNSYPQDITEFEFCIRIVEESLGLPSEDRKLPSAEQLFKFSEPIPGQIDAWYQHVFDNAECLGLTSSRTNRDHHG